ncbi:hypothetical protein [Halofilum ochraceum]|uniref:hypothetical protein n=1 Tax=Halofilum ochraceum TaxID=1611323 RepID=UPI0008DA929B|nr:hypothetical protein [Halofilum ochraceum]
MTNRFEKSALAIAVAAVIAAPAAMAEGYESDSSVEMDKETDTEKEIDYEGEVSVGGYIDGDALGMAVIENRQDNGGNEVLNKANNNSASVDDNAMREGSGNLGANAAAGDNNSQSNAAALAAADADFVFGHGDAEAFSKQTTGGNRTANIGARNSANLGGNALQDATGNIGVNVTAGNSNSQQNNFAATTGADSMAEAGVSTRQSVGGNETVNSPSYDLEFEQLTAEIDMGGPESGVSGSYEGDVDQSNNVYPDNWDHNPEFGDENQHPNAPAPSLGHSDFDSETQTNSSDEDNAPLDEDGAFEFEEAGDIELSGTASVSMGYAHLERDRRTTNNASIDGNALRGATGNIGVNVASGTNNLQSNSLSVVSVGPEGNGGGE